MCATKKEPATLAEHIANRAVSRQRPDGSAYRSLSYDAECCIAATVGVSHKEVQIAALGQDITPERYARNQKSLNNQEQLRLLQSHVAIVGMGGLGGTVTEILARIGVGALTLIDGDSFEDSNLNRQILSSVDELGKMKAEVAARRVLTLNPAVEVVAKTDFLRRRNGQALLAGASLAVDCLDTIGDRFVLEEVCRKMRIPLISAAIGGMAGQAMAIFPDDPGLRLVYGSPAGKPKKGAEAALGTLPFAAIAMAAIECAEVVTLAIGRPSQLRNSLIVADFGSLSVERLNFS